MQRNQVYLGDGVYARYDGFHIVLSTMEGVIIYLDPEVLENLNLFKNEIIEQQNKVKEEQACVEQSPL